MSASGEWFVLHRVPDDPSRAQVIQVVHTAHALARAGLRVTLPVEGCPEQLLAALGLDRPPSLVPVRLGRGTTASLRLRAALLTFLARTRGRGVIGCRHLRYAHGVVRRLGARARLLLELHEVARREAEQDGVALAPRLAAEAEVLRCARWLVANAEGTLERVRLDHADLPPARVCHNAAPLAPAPRGRGVGVGIVGSVRPYKDPDTVARAARLLGGGVTWVGVAEADRARLDGVSGGHLATRPPVPHREVPALLGSFRTLVLPLSPGDTFGEALTSPLKLWDALQSGVPLVAADTRAIRRAAPDGWIPYVPGDAASLVDAVRAAERPEVRDCVLAAARRHARTWDDRAAELLRFTGLG